MGIDGAVVGTVTGLLAAVMALALKTIISSQAAAKQASDTTAQRYEREIEALKADRDKVIAEKNAEIQFWRERALNCE